MNPDRAEEYWEAITVIEAQECLIKLRIADYPYSKAEQRRKTHKEFHRLAYPKTHDGATLTTEQLAERLKAAING